MEKIGYYDRNAISNVIDNDRGFLADLQQMALVM